MDNPHDFIESACQAMFSTLDLLDGFLNTPPRIIFTHRDTFTGTPAEFEKIVSHRYIRVLRGRLWYQVDQSEAELDEGTIFFVAKGSQRSWGVPAGSRCELVWCEFETPGVSPDPHNLFFANDSKKQHEKASLIRLMKLWKFPRHLRGGPHGDPELPREIALIMEGELKASLARFWTSATPWKPGSDRQPPKEERVHPAIRKALVWMEENYQNPEAHKRLIEEAIDLSPNHFRLLFSKHVGSSISAHLQRLRLNEAMNLLRSSSLSIKEISAAVGFNDPLYFSKCFHERWDIPPSGVRK